VNRAQEIEDRAAHFVLRREEQSWSADDQQHLDQWLEESDAHKAAYWRLEHGWREADRIGSIGRVEAGRGGAYGPLSNWTKIVALAACLALFVLGFAVLRPELGLIGQGYEAATPYRTAIGGHELVALADGSRVELNTDTAIRASAKRRSVWLERGEAFFDVASASGRQFVVHAAGRSVVVLGTQFSVRLKGDELTVAVLEGRVRIEDGEDSERSTTIGAGSIAVANKSGLLLTNDTPSKVRALLAWRSGRLLFDDARLSEAAAQFNRYNRKQLIITDADAAKIRIGGSFDARNVDAFARLLGSAYGLNVQSASDRISVSS
jgi:transmembrane sensor